MYNVKLIYYKPNGKFYSEGDYISNKIQLFEIWEEVRSSAILGRLPGLVEGHSHFIISIDVPEHPYNHPHLIL